MKTDQVVVAFDSNFVGTMTSPTAKVALGGQTNGAQPYHLLYGALASCFYSTFLSVAKKKRLTFKNAVLTVNGTKRDQTPPTLEHVAIEMVVEGATDPEAIKKSAELGAQYCSIHETIKQVAKIDLNVTFK